MTAPFAVPWIPWLLLCLPALVLTRAWLDWRRSRRLATFAQPVALAALLPRRSRWRWVHTGAIAAGVTMLLLAAAGPRWGQGPAPDFVPGRDIVLVIDMSRSMMATDAPPTRFDRARDAVFEMVHGLQRRGGHRLAVVVFAADAEVVVPLTHDYSHVLNKLEALDVFVPPTGLRPRSDSVSGTRLGSALRRALTAFAADTAGFQDVVVLSDGDDPLGDADWQEGLRALTKAGIPVHTVGIGDPERASPVPGRQPAVTRLREHPLREIARQTGGHYLAAHCEAPRLAEFFQQRIEPKPVNVPVATLPPPQKSRHLWFYLAATLLLGASWFVGSYE